MGATKINDLPKFLGGLKSLENPIKALKEYNNYSKIFKRVSNYVVFVTCSREVRISSWNLFYLTTTNALKNVGYFVAYVLLVRTYP